MKQWKTPGIEEMKIELTAAPVDVTNMTSGQIAQLDLGTCGEGNNPYWVGNGLTKDEALAENPFWGGNWGQ